MKKKTKIFLSVILSFFVLLSATIIGLAYYEYYGQYSSIINIDGTIRVDAFDCLYDDLRTSALGYGFTPENPYVIDNVARLQNLIRLNNSGKLNKTRTAAGVDRYYFCLEFDEQTVKQVLDLSQAGEISTIGNDTYPFSDELSGVVYSYGGNYYSGCLPTVTVKNGLVTRITGEASVAVGDASAYDDGTYVLLKPYTGTNPSGFDDEVYVNIESSALKPIHQIISSATIAADTNQVDIGFFSNISATGNVHDLILYNTTIKAVEPTPKTVWDYLNDFLIGGILTITNTNNTSDEITHIADATALASDERHIGIFAGHIDGQAANISVAGNTNVEINTLGVNYYSQYTTVGYISKNAKINGTSYSQLASDGFLTGGNSSGCLFADNIYSIKGEAIEYSDASNDKEKHYKLTEIAEDFDMHWPGTDGVSFSYGAFTFLCSSDNDTLSTVWNNSSNLKMLGLAEYDINTSVLYCADEYRYSSEASAGGSIISSATSVAEGLYAGIRDLESGGSVVDSGKYLIVARVGTEGNYSYYALKLTATETGSSVSYNFDDSDAINVTSYINDNTGNKKIALSALWDVFESTTTPTFCNARFDNQYLVRSTTGLSLDEDSSSTFNVDITEHTLYFTSESNGITTQYYVTFDNSSKTFGISTESTSEIMLYHVSNGYNLQPVTSANQITETGSYLIVAENGNNAYLLGTEIEDGRITGNISEELTPDAFSSGIPSSISLAQYNEIINYIWYADALNGTGVPALRDKASLTYYLTINNNAVALSTTSMYLTYQQRGDNYGSLANNGNYISYNNGFIRSNSAYNLHLYKLAPQDDTPLYISYDGGRHLDAESTLVEAGEYVFAAEINGTQYALGLTGTTTLNTNAANATLNSANPTQGNGYYWKVNSTDYSFQLVNKQYTSSKLYSNGTNIAANTSYYVNWMYDAINANLYFDDEGTIKYLYCTINSNTLTWSVSTTNKATIRLYKSEPLYNITNIQKNTDQFYSYSQTNPYYYFISYYDITNANNPLFLLSYSSELAAFHGSQSNKDYLVGGMSSYSLTTNPYSNGTISTTDINIQMALWGFEGSNLISNNAGDTYYNYNTNTNITLNATATNTKTGYLYNKFYNENTPSEYSSYGNKLYLAANQATGDRDISVTTQKAERYGSGSGGNGEYNSGFAIYGRSSSNRYVSRTDNTGSGTTAIGFIAGADPYWIYRNTSKTNFGIKKGSSYAQQSAYIYRCQFSISSVLTLISSNGDILDDDKNYMIAAKYNDKYYGLTYDMETSTTAITATDVSSYVEAIMNEPYNGQTTEVVNVPKNCDWTCSAKNTTDLSETMFYSTAYSTATAKYYLSANGANLRASEVTTGTTNNIMKIYYDIVNKVVKCISNGTTYYLTFDGTNFGLSTNRNNAADMNLFRYNATYTVRIIDSSDSSLVNGDFIIGIHSADGFTAVGSNGSGILYRDVTNELTSEISEDTYNSIYNYIFAQSYYNDNQSFTDSQTSFYFRQLNKTKNGSLAIKQTDYNSGNALAGYPYEYTWKIDVNTSNGMWKFNNGEKIGNESVDQFTLTTTKNNSSSALTLGQTYKAINSYLSIDGVSTGSAVRIIEVNGDTYTDYTGSLEVGKNYIILARATNNYYYLIGSENNNIKTQSIGKTADGYQSYITDNTYLLAGYENGTNNYGVSLKFVNSSTRYLALNGTNITASSTAQYFEYKYDSIYTTDSRLYTVAPATASGRLQPDGNKVVSGKAAATADIATYLYTYDSNSGKYLLATSLVNNTSYGIILFMNGKYYSVTLNDAGNVIAELLGSGVPATFNDNQLWTWNSNNFHPKANTSLYLSMGSKGALEISSTAPNPALTWSYSGKRATNSASLGYANKSNTYSLYLFNIRKADSLSATADVDSPLNYHSALQASISVLESQDYIIVGEANGRYYALAMDTSDIPMALDITDTFIESKEDGKTIAIYDSCVWNQIGSDYNLVFDNQGFENQTEENHNNYNITLDANTSFYEVVVAGNMYILSEEESSLNADLVYAIIKEENSKYYLYGVNMDGEASFIEYDNLPTNVNQNELWSYISQNGSEYNITPYDMDVYIKEYNLLSGDRLDRSENGGPMTINYPYNLPNDMENYIWTIYPYGTRQYILGNFDVIYGNASYMYFDTTDYLFKFTTDENVAKENKVQIYQLGMELSDLAQVSFQTFEIDMNADGFTIDSFPLTEVSDCEEIKKYTTTKTTGTIDTLIEGEYMIIAKDRGSYFAMILNENGDIALRDVSLLFGGNFLRDTAGNYCLSINEQYIWRQTSNPTYNNGIASGLTLINVKKGEALSLNGSSLSYNALTKQLYSSNSYLSYSRSTGFTVSNNQSPIEILFYKVGNSGIATGQNDDSLQYTYYSFALNTQAIDYSYFEFEKYNINKLMNYSVDEVYNEIEIANNDEYIASKKNLYTRSGDGSEEEPYVYTSVEDSSYVSGTTYYLKNLNLNSSEGWNITSKEMLSTVNNSVYYSAEINHDEYESVGFDYNYQDMETGEEKLKSGEYYAPKGVLSFVVSEASAANPIFVNVIVSTEINTSLNLNDELRYLSMWKIAGIDAATAAITDLDNNDITSAGADIYKNILESKFYTPDSAIPLPNYHASVSSGASYVKVKNGGFIEQEVNSITYNALKSLLYIKNGDNYEKLTDSSTFSESTAYYRQNDTNTVYTLGTTPNTGHNHLIAHTYTISDPGIYYIGATCANVAFCYVSIDNRIEADAGEDNSTNVSDAFSIDYVWGDIATSNTDFDEDLGVGSIAYVGRKDEEQALSWTHSNIYPEFTFGTSGLALDPDENQSNSEYNPCDYVNMTISRKYEDTISTVLAECYTTAKIYADGDGIMYLNSNSSAQRVKRKLEFIIYQDDNKDLSEEAILATYGVN